MIKEQITINKSSFKEGVNVKHFENIIIDRYYDCLEWVEEYNKEHNLDMSDCKPFEYSITNDSITITADILIIGKREIDITKDVPLHNETITGVSYTIPFIDMYLKVEELKVIAIEV